MTDKEDRKKARIDRYKPYVATADSGIFGKEARKKILGMRRIWGGRGGEKGDKGKIRADINTFWYRTRNQVKTALKDLELFIEFADEKNVNQAVTVETLEPVVNSLLRTPIFDVHPPAPNRAEIARLFIDAGLDYLREKKPKHITGSHQETIEQAIDLVNYLVEMFKPEEERIYSAPGRVYSR